jgi:hypothetical protein
VNYSGVLRLAWKSCKWVKCFPAEVLKCLKLLMQSVWPLHLVCIVVSSSSSSMKMVDVFCYVDDARMVPTSENNGEIIWRTASKNIMCLCVMNFLIVKMCRGSRLVLILKGRGTVGIRMAFEGSRELSLIKMIRWDFPSLGCYRNRGWVRKTELLTEEERERLKAEIAGGPPIGGPNPWDL